MSRILCVTNRKLCQEDFLTRVEKIASCHPEGIILREKDLSPEEYRILAKQVMEICERYGVKCILHSFVDTAIALQAKALHVPLHILCEMTPEQKRCFDILGASCHSMEDTLLAQKLGCTYITAGHIFDTDCKKGLPGRGIEFLQSICSAVSIPVYGIGGIDAENISRVLKAGAAGACLMSSLMVCRDVAEFINAMEEKQ